MAHKHMKMFSNSLIIGKKKFKVTLWYHFPCVVLTNQVSPSIGGNEDLWDLLVGTSIKKRRGKKLEER